MFLHRYRTEGMAFEIPKEHTNLAMRGKFTVDTYELPERTLIKRHLSSAAAVLELGGCIGVVSCVINRVLAHPRRHVVIEGNPNVIDVLKRNRDSNGCSFHIQHGVVSCGRHPKMSVGHVADCNQLAGTGVEVPAFSIEHLERVHALTFDTLVMDIEGGEYDVLRENTCHLPRLRAAIIEFHPTLIGEAKTVELYHLLARTGFRKIDEILGVQAWVRG
jgi:FkbM family methyltransferase